MILAIPMKSRPRASSVTSTSVAKIGNAKTAIPNRATNAPRPMLPNLDNFDDRCDFVKPVTTLSIPTTNSVAERRSIRVAIPNPGFKITPSDNAMAIPPSTICKILVPLGDSISSVFKFIHMQNYCDLLMIDILIAK